jgi:hypothetical protein
LAAAVGMALWWKGYDAIAKEYAEGGILNGIQRRSLHAQPITLKIV